MSFTVLDSCRDAHRVLYYWHTVETGSDHPVKHGYKSKPHGHGNLLQSLTRVLQKIVIEENRFGFEPEITAKSVS
jgi:hypothetical protein